MESLWWIKHAGMMLDEDRGALWHHTVSKASYLIVDSAS